MKAIQFTGDNFDEVIAFIKGSKRSYGVYYSSKEIELSTVDGFKIASAGDYIIQEDDEFYPCKLNIFQRPLILKLERRIRNQRAMLRRQQEIIDYKRQWRHTPLSSMWLALCKKQAKKIQELETEIANIQLALERKNHR